MKRVFLLLLAARTVGASAQLVTLQGTGISVGTGAQLTVKGAVLAAAGTTIDNQGTIDLTGDITNNSGSELFTTAPGLVIMNGTTQQIGGGSVIQFDALDLQCATLTLQQDAVVKEIDLNDAIVHLNTRRLTVNDASPTAITSNTGHMVSETDPLSGAGEVEWRIGTSTGTYTVPFGTGTSYLPLTLAIASAGSGAGSFVCSTYPTDPMAAPNNRPLPVGLSVLTDIAGLENAPNTLDRFWSVVPSAYISAPSAALTFTYRDSEWNSGTNTIAEGALQAQYFNGAQWSATPMGSSNTPLNTLTTPPTNAYGTVWALTQSFTPLPVELLHFDAQPEGDRVLCTWATATELDNDRFTVERSADGTFFTDIGEVDGAGFSQQTIHYVFPDEAPLPGLSYYRLRQTDFDGTETRSMIVAVWRDGRTEELAVFPNPCTDVLFTADAIPPGAEVEAIDATGRIISLPGGSGGSRLDVSALPAGAYVLRVNGEGGLRTARFIKQ